MNNQKHLMHPCAPEAGKCTSWVAGLRHCRHTLCATAANSRLPVVSARNKQEAAIVHLQGNGTRSERHAPQRCRPTGGRTCGSRKRPERSSRSPMTNPPGGRTCGGAPATKRRLPFPKPKGQTTWRTYLHKQGTQWASDLFEGVLASDEGVHLVHMQHDWHQLRRDDVALRLNVLQKAPRNTGTSQVPCT
jgi:hypothetical protein